MRPSLSRSVAGFSALLKTAHHLADLSSGVILPRFRRPISIDDKGSKFGFDPVTAADRDAERAISRYLARNYPGHAIVGEEHGGRDGDGSSALRWVIDPIDGTKAFIMGSPMWGTLIGLLDGDTPVLGMMNQPFTGERVWSGQTAAHWRTSDGRTRRVRTRACKRLAECIVTTTSPDLLGKDDRERFNSIASRARLTRYGGDCYGYCLLAGGHVDLVIETGLKPHDVVALIPIIERAGGRITTWDGDSATGGGRIVAAGDPALHAAAVKILAG
jgi:histidinol phosphatase-like enzyme (inositol monophosphatase family)